MVLNQENILAGKEKTKSLIEKENMVNLRRVGDIGEALEVEGKYIMIIS